MHVVAAVHLSATISSGVLPSRGPYGQILYYTVTSLKTLVEISIDLKHSELK
jgi:hypothetical protein